MALRQVWLETSFGTAQWRATAHVQLAFVFGAACAAQSWFVQAATVLESTCCQASLPGDPVVFVQCQLMQPPLTSDHVHVLVGALPSRQFDWGHCSIAVGCPSGSWLVGYVQAAFLSCCLERSRRNNSAGVVLSQHFWN
jgi:hypothetical protein